MSDTDKIVNAFRAGTLRHIVRTQGRPANVGRTGTVVEIHGTIAGDTLCTVKWDDGPTSTVYTRQIEQTTDNAEHTSADRLIDPTFIDACVINASIETAAGLVAEVRDQAARRKQIANQTVRTEAERVGRTIIVTGGQASSIETLMQTINNAVARYSNTRSIDDYNSARSLDPELVDAMIECANADLAYTNADNCWRSIRHLANDTAATVINEAVRIGAFPEISVEACRTVALARHDQQQATR